MDSLAVPATDRSDQSKRPTQAERSEPPESPDEPVSAPLEAPERSAEINGQVGSAQAPPLTRYDGRVLTGMVIGLVLAVGLLSLGGAFFGGLGALLLIAVYAALVVNDWHGFTGFLSLSRWPGRSGTGLPLYVGRIMLSAVAVLLLAMIYPIIGAVRYAEGYVAEKRP